MQPSEMTNVQIADYILSLQSDVDGFPFSSNEIIREAAKRLLTDGDDDISKDAEIAELRECLHEAVTILDCHIDGNPETCHDQWCKLFDYENKSNCIMLKWRKALEGVK